MRQLNIPKIKGLPPGWDPIFFDECQCGHDHDAVVMCERTVDDGDHGTDYVVWDVNMDLGGCFLGFYTDDRDAALTEFARKRGRIN